MNGSASERNTGQANGVEAPYPILKRFQFRIVPILLLFITILVIATTTATRSAIEKVYLQLAVNRAEGIAHGVSEDAPRLWQILLSGKSLDQAGLRHIDTVIRDELAEFKLAKIKIYDLTRKTIYSTDLANIGKIEHGAGLTAVLENSKAIIIPKREGRDIPLYELYVPLVVDGETVAVFELYEPTTLLDDILFKTMKPAATWPTLLFSVLIISLWVVVRHAQQDIDDRTATINRLRERLESLVSRSAVDAVKRTADEDAIHSELVESTIFYSDIRQFSSYAEKHSPKEVIDFLNDIMELQIHIIHNYHGDVDKMVGDAVLARFQGDKRHEHAVLAALAVQHAMEQRKMDRGIGIGVYSGEVIAGGIGPKNRLDYTIIGDTVNVSARLCALADVGEVVVDCQTLDKVPDISGFGLEQSVQVKGRKGNLKIRKNSVYAPHT